MIVKERLELLCSGVELWVKGKAEDTSDMPNFPVAQLGMSKVTSKGFNSTEAKATAFNEVF